MEDLNTFRSPLSSRYASKEMQFNFSDVNKITNWRRLWTNLAEAQKEMNQPHNVVSQNDVRPIKGINKNLSFSPMTNYYEAANGEMSTHFLDSMVVYNDTNVYGISVDSREMPSMEYEAANPLLMAALPNTSSPLAAHASVSPFPVNLSPIVSSQVALTNNSRHFSTGLVNWGRNNCNPVHCPDCSYMRVVVEPAQMVIQDVYKPLPTNSHRFLHQEFYYQNETTSNMWHSPQYKYFTPDTPDLYTYQDVFDLNAEVQRLRKSTIGFLDVKLNYDVINEENVDLSDIGSFQMSGFLAKKFFQFNQRTSVSDNSDNRGNKFLD